MPILIQLLYILFCIILARDNADRIKQNKKIYHALNGVIHLTVAVVCAYYIHWAMFPIILLTARLFFTSALNLFRGKKLFYVTPTPTSFTDKIEQKIFKKNAVLPFFLYLVLWITFNTIILL